MFTEHRKTLRKTLETDDDHQMTLLVIRTAPLRNHWLPSAINNGQSV